MKHVNNMSTARRETTRGYDTITHSTLNQDAPLPTIHVESNIQLIQRRQVVAYSHWIAYG
eukprot:1413922-Amphidinium_carterae.1